MRIACHTCKQIWEVPSGHSLSARLRFGLGLREESFVCPNCQARNVISKQEYDTSDPQIAVVGKPAQTDTSPNGHLARADNDLASPPTNPVPGPDPNARQFHAVVLEPGLRLQREHHPLSETMGMIHKREHIIILDTWTDGENVWIQLGPERWAAVEQDGEAVIQLLET